MRTELKILNTDRELSTLLLILELDNKDSQLSD